MAAFDVCKKRCNIELPSLDARMMCSISSTMSLYNNQKADNGPSVLLRYSMYSSDRSNRTDLECLPGKDVIMSRFLQVVSKTSYVFYCLVDLRDILRMMTLNPG